MVSTICICCSDDRFVDHLRTAAILYFGDLGRRAVHELLFTPQELPQNWRPGKAGSKRKMQHVMIAVSIIVLAGIARVYLGVHWASDVLGGLLLGIVSLAGLLWVYSGMKTGHLELLGLQFRVTQCHSPKPNWAGISLGSRRSRVRLALSEAAF